MIKFHQVLHSQKERPWVAVLIGLPSKRTPPVAATTIPVAEAPKAAPATDAVAASARPNATAPSAATVAAATDAPAASVATIAPAPAPAMDAPVALSRQEERNITSQNTGSEQYGYDKFSAVMFAADCTHLQHLPLLHLLPQLLQLLCFDNHRQRMKIRTK